MPAASGRISSWCSTNRASTPPCCRTSRFRPNYRARFRSSDAQGALVRGRGRRRPELVHRIQRAHRTVRALLWPLRRVRHPAGHRAGQARLAPCVARVRLQDLQPLFMVRRISSAPAASRPRRGSSISSTPSNWAAGRRIPIASTTTTLPASSREQRDNGPVFVFVYLAVNHFPWNYRYRPDLLPGWVNPGNPFEIDEYLRRQELSAHDYRQFKERLGRELPDDQFLLVRFGDHQPLFAKRFLDPTLDQAAVAERILCARSALFHHLLCDRRAELPAARSFIRARYARRALPSAGGAGRSGGAARCDLRGAKADPQPLPWPVLSLRRRRGSAAFQSASDRCRLDPGALNVSVLGPQ